MSRMTYSPTPSCRAAFVVSLEVRRHALLHAARTGSVSARDLQREFTAYDRTDARDQLHVLRDHGYLSPGEVVLDVQGKLRQQTYVLTPDGRAALVELRDWINAFLAMTDTTDPQSSCQTTRGEGVTTELEEGFREIAGLPAVNHSPKGQD